MFNPRVIIETEEKAKYRMKAIPLPIQFVQYCIEEHQYINFPSENDWEKKHEFRYEILYGIFVEYQQRNGATKVIPLNTFRDCLSKRLNIQIHRRDRSNGRNIRYYTFGNNPDDIINILKEKGLYNEI